MKDTREEADNNRSHKVSSANALQIQVAPLSVSSQTSARKRAAGVATTPTVNPAALLQRSKPSASSSSRRKHTSHKQTPISSKRTDDGNETYDGGEEN